MLVKWGNKYHHYQMCQWKQTKCLGMIIDCDLSSSNHIDTLTIKQTCLYVLEIKAYQWWYHNKNSLSRIVRFIYKIWPQVWRDATVQLNLNKIILLEKKTVGTYPTLDYRPGNLSPMILNIILFCEFSYFNISYLIIAWDLLIYSCISAF